MIIRVMGCLSSELPIKCTYEYGKSCQGGGGGGGAGIFLK